MELPKSSLAVRVDNFLERHGKLTSLVSILGFAMGLVSAAYIGLRGFIRSSDPVGAGFLIVTLTLLSAGVLGQAAKAITSWLLERSKEKEWPVNLGCDISTSDGVISLKVWNGGASEEMKVVVGSTFGPKTHTTPYGLPWVHYAGEYRHIPRKASDTVKLCGFVASGVPIENEGSPVLRFSLPSVHGAEGQYALDLSTFWTGMDDEAVGSIMFHVAVVGKDSGFKKDFHVLIEGRAQLSSPKRMILTVDIPESRSPGRPTRAFATLFHEDLHAVRAS